MRSFSSTPIILAAATLVLTALTPLAHAQSTYTFYPNNTTINSDVTTDYAIIGYAGGSYNADGTRNFTGASSPTVGIGNGATLIGETDVFNQSVVNVTGGDIGFLVSNDGATVNLSGGNVGFVLSFDHTVFNMTGGHVSDLEGQGQAIHISGGTVDTLVANVQSSPLGDVLGSDVVDITGGSFGQTDAQNLGVLNVRGGTFADRILAAFGGTVNIYGTGLSATLLDPNFTGLGSSYSRYALSGTLGDGSVLTNHDLLIRNDRPGDGSFQPSSFNLISTATAPEPGSWAFLWTGLLPVAVVFQQRLRGSV